jgi:hypothetical protein
MHDLCLESVDSKGVEDIHTHPARPGPRESEFSSVLVVQQGS